MTTNHPAHGPVSLDRLHQIREILSKAAAQSDGGNLGYAMADAVKVIDGAIAAFGAEPALVDIEMLATVLRNAPLAPSDSQGKPRAPVVPDEYRHLSELYHAQEKRLFKLAQRIKGPSFDKYAHSPSQAIDVLEAVIFGEDDDSCRAAMLQAGNHTEQHLDMVDHSGDTHKMVAGNSPVIGVDLASGPDRTVEVRYVAPPGYVMVPKEMTDAIGEAIAMQANCCGGIALDIYDAMLAAAPHQEVKSALEHGMRRYAGAMQKLSEGDD